MTEEDAARLAMWQAIAEAGGARLAVKIEHHLKFSIEGLFGPNLADAMKETTPVLTFVMLSPGERPPAGQWTIYELTAQGWRGRSA